MPNFRFYLLDLDGRIKGRQDIECEDDLAARRIAMTIDHPYAVEIWQDSRRVGMVATKNAQVTPIKPKA
jgi:hypothetical protein